MAVTHGAKVEVLDQIAEQLTSDGHSVDQIHQSANTSIATLSSAWRGGDMERFKGQWGSNESRLVDAQQSLIAMAKALRQQGQQQRTTSDAGSGTSDVPLVPSAPGAGAGPGSGDLMGDLFKGRLNPIEAFPDEFIETFPDELIKAFTPAPGESWAHKALAGLGLVPTDLEPQHVAAWAMGLGPLVAGNAATVAQVMAAGGKWGAAGGTWASSAASRAAAMGNSSTFAKWGTVGKWANKAGGIVAGVMAGVDEAIKVWDDPNLSTSQKAGQVATMAVATGSGAMAGAYVGATIGSFAGPVGTLIGGAIGGLIGSSFGQAVGEAVKGFVGDVTDSVVGAVESAGEAIGDAAEAVGDFMSDVGDALKFW